jgi:hypothetical protein
MPKGALHHLHTTAAPNADFYLALTYEDCVYYNDREKMFKVAPHGLDEDGYLKCADMRKFYRSPAEYDEWLLRIIKMTKEECEKKESHEIWNEF